MKKIKFKKLKTLMFSTMFVMSNFAFTSNASGIYDGGIYKQTNNESKVYQYEELTFVTGQPVVLKGTLTRTKVDKSKEDELLQKAISKAKKSQKKGKSSNSQDTSDIHVTYNGTKISEKYSLSGGGVTLTRDLSITPKNEYNNGQIIQKNEVSKIRETITLSGTSYTLDNNLSEVSDSAVIDKKPAIDYYAGNFNFNKVYKSTNGTLTIQMDGKSAGYDNFWGSTSTKTMDYTINTVPNETTNNTTDNNKQSSVPVNGTYSVKLSQNTTKELIYSENDPKKISFAGGYIVTSQNNAALEYTYDINGDTGKGQLENQNTPSITRLFAPVITDIQGHYAQEAIKIIASMNGFDISKKMILPNAPISRDEFARAVVVTSGLYNNNADKKKTSYILKEELFSDVKTKDPMYNYVKKAVDSKLMIGRDDNKFEPKNPITKAEAIKILTDSLGLDSLIPNGKFSVGYEDQSNIPPWAYDNVFIAQKIGLIEKGGALHPNEQLTKSDASEMLLRYIEYMTGDLKEDFMTNILNY